MARDGYKWWRQRLQWAARYYHICRIDHIVGLFRVWTYPRSSPTQPGQFLPHDPARWLPGGEALLKMMQSATDMLFIGEDLGLIPEGVREIMRSMEICRTQVMRWERQWHEGGKYVPLDQYEPVGMTTLSTHDSEPIAEWWQLYPEEAGQLAANKGWSYHPVLARQYHEELLWDSHHTSSFLHINPIQEYFALIPELTWKDPSKNRINVPGIISDFNWSYRTPFSLEDWTSHKALNAAIQRILNG
jgi:4-alpha-glucanotransferase